LQQVVSAADAVSRNDADVIMSSTDIESSTRYQSADKESERTDIANQNGAIRWGGQMASLQGTGGVALLEYAKDAIQTAVSNISSIGTNQMQIRKITERKMSNQ